MKWAAKKMGKKVRDVTFVGVHARRTDSVQFVQWGHHEEELTAEYYKEAMAYFREEYDHPAFLMVSDDMEWCKENLAGEAEKHGDLFFVGMQSVRPTRKPHINMVIAFPSGKGNEEDDSIALDFTTLVSSNHTIISRGTFSMWAGILCGGEYYSEYGTIVPDDILYT
jgi:galactoside 2-L-fucosyltransferase 1/2